MTRSAESAAEKQWMTGTEAELRVFIKRQDARFQAAMRAYLEPVQPEVAPSSPKPATVPVQKPRDVLLLATPTDEPRPAVRAEVVKQIIRDCCAKHSVSQQDIMSTRQDQKVVAARYEAFYRLRTETPLSLPHIGRRLGGKDHTTVLHGIRKHMARHGIGARV